MRRVLIAVALCLLWVRPAHADQIDLQVRQLRSAGSYKLRLSAALALAKTRDRRAIVAMIRALRRDGASTVRQVAALSLGKMIDRSVKQKIRKTARVALRRTVRDDDDRKVRKAAARALEQLRPLQQAKNPSVFVNVGRPSDRSGKAPRGATRLLERRIQRTIGSEAPSFAQRWPGGDLPTRSELRRAGVRGFYVGATVSGLEVDKNGRRAEVRCAVSIRVSPWDGKDGKERMRASEAASASGNAKVVGSANRSGIRRSIAECLSAVSAQITERQVIPFIERVVN